MDRMRIIEDENEGEIAEVETADLVINLNGEEYRYSIVIRDLFGEIVTTIKVSSYSENVLIFSGILKERKCIER